MAHLFHFTISHHGLVAVALTLPAFYSVKNADPSFKIRVVLQISCYLISHLGSENIIDISKARY